MTDPERKALERYIRRLANLMGLRDWSLGLMGDPCESESYATITIPFAQRRAEIRVCAEFRGLAPKEQRATIAHELVHCHMEPLWDWIVTIGPKLTGQAQWGALKAAADQHREQAVDDVAQSWAEKLPLIKWPK